MRVDEPESDEIVEVAVLGVPVALWERATAHQEAIQREFDIVRASQPIESVPNRLQRLIDEFDARFGPASEPTWDELRLAAAHGASDKDLIFRVPEAAARASRQLRDILAEVDDYCRHGALVTLATPDDLVAFREWFLGEFINQIENKSAPTRWSEYVLANDATTSVDKSSSASDTGDTVSFSGPLDLTTAGLLREEIQSRRKQGLTKLTLDLSGVGFVDSIGVGLLVTTHNRLASEGVELRLIATRRLRDLLDLSGLTDLLNPEIAPESSQDS